jgi:hypothetical protein
MAGTEPRICFIIAGDKDENSYIPRPRHRRSARLPPSGGQRRAGALLVLGRDLGAGHGDLQAGERAARSHPERCGRDHRIKHAGQ